MSRLVQMNSFEPVANCLLRHIIMRNALDGMIEFYHNHIIRRQMMLEIQRT